jgi:hypothetical protein
MKMAPNLGPGPAKCVPCFCRLLKGGGGGALPRFSSDLCRVAAPYAHAVAVHPPPPPHTPPESSLPDRYIPAALALATVPFIVHPIDHGTDWVLDRTVRPYLDQLGPAPELEHGDKKHE